MSESPVRLFVGSSTEGEEIAVNLQAELERRGICEVDLWAHVFEPSGFALESLLRVASQVDFAVLVATPDDVSTVRGQEFQTARDNVLLEFGIFLAALGRERTYLLSRGDLRIPSDLLGLTRLIYRERADKNVAAALNEPVLRIKQQVTRLGRRSHDEAARTAASMSHEVALATEITILCGNAEAQGWCVKTNDLTTLRLCTPKGVPHTMSKGRPDVTRVDLRRFARELKAAGLRVNSSVRRPVEESPFKF